MSLRFIALAAIVVVALSAAWGKRHVLDNLFAPAPPPPRAIEFDNGTVRQYQAPTEAAPAPGQSRFPQGAMRKCVRGQETSYTNMACPPGYREKAVAGPPVNVLPGQAPARPAEPRGTGGAQSPLHESLGLARDEKLRGRMIDRAIEGN